MSRDRIEKRGHNDVGHDDDMASPTSGHQAAVMHKLVQRRRAAETERLRNAVQAKAAEEPAHIQQAATEGTAGAGQSLPFLDRIQQAFGPHDVSGVQAHVGAEASAASDKMGARAFATGNHVAFAGTPDLHTVAHETAHVVQQRGGIQLKGGVGAEGDAHEGDADKVADRVVAGGSAADLLAPYAGGGETAVASSGVQRIVEPGAKLGISVFVTLGDGQFATGTISEEVADRGYLVDVDGRTQLFGYSQLNLHDPRGTDASLGQEKWREYVRGQDQGKGPTAYDGDGAEFGRKLEPGQSYGASMTKAQDTVSDSLGVPMSPDYIEGVHAQGSEHLSRVPDWRNKRSGNDYDGRIGVTLLDQHADPGGIETMRGSKTMSYGGRGGGSQMTHDGQMMHGPVTHRIATQPMSQEEIQGKLQEITETYYQTIGRAQRQDEILDAIAQFTQDLARLHPFENANTRTNMLLLNKLLAENGFPLAIVDDPKHFYLNKLSAWREKIVAGMKKWSSVGGQVGDESKKPKKSSSMSSVRRGKMLEVDKPKREPLEQPDDGLDIEVRPLEELFEDDPEGLEALREGMTELEIQHNTHLIQQRQIAIDGLQSQMAELNQLFATYATLVARSSDTTGQVEQHLGQAESNVEDGNRNLHH